MWSQQSGEEKIKRCKWGWRAEVFGSDSSCYLHLPVSFKCVSVNCLDHGRRLHSGSKMRFQAGILQPGPQGKSGIPPSQEETSGLDKSFKLILYTKGLIIYSSDFFFFFALSLEPGCLRYKKLLRNLQRLVMECRGPGGGREEWVSRQRDPVQWLTVWYSSREIHFIRSDAKVDD